MLQCSRLVGLTEPRYVEFSLYHDTGSLFVFSVDLLTLPEELREKGLLKAKYREWTKKEETYRKTCPAFLIADFSNHFLIHSSSVQCIIVKGKYNHLFYVFLQTQAEKLSKVYQPLRSALGIRSKISVAHLLAARQDFSKILRTSSGRIREKTACAINKVSYIQGLSHEKVVVRTKREIGQTKFLFHQGMCALAWRMSGGTKINF